MTFRPLLALLLLASSLPASVIKTATLTGSQENPANASTATGSGSATLSDDEKALAVLLTFSGLTAPGAASHIHCCSGPGVNSSVAIDFASSGIFPLGATSGTFSFTFDLTNSAIYGSGFRTANGGTAEGARTAFVAGFLAGNSYMNIHNSSFPGGEIRGQLVPEPGTLTMAAAGLLALGLLRRR